MDETSKQLIGETRTPRAMEPGHAHRYDYEYERNGVANLLLFVEPLRGWRRVDVTARRTRQDWATAVKRLLDEDYPTAERVILVMDNLNTHVGGALYETFPPTEARRLLDRLELHYTPKHGSWLNMAEIEFSVLGRQCLDRRIADTITLVHELAAWEKTRNHRQATISWPFATADARIKLKRLYPSVSV
jgi:transposase